MAEKLAVIKIGGKLAENRRLLLELGNEIRGLKSSYSFLLIHGGGAEVSARSKQLGMEPVFKDGVRITSPREMDVVDEVLGGRINTRLVRLFGQCGLKAVGLSCASGGIITGESLDPGNGSSTRTGKITAIDPELPGLLMERGYFPVLSSTAADGQGVGLNINADTAAFALAAALHCEVLLFFSDIPGVLKEDRVIETLDADQARREIELGTISGGMIPKISSSLDALEHGVESIIIAQYEAHGSLAGLLAGKGGTRLYKE
ncbi:MAG: acetylglutamate kinase [Spirochaetia bacterium]